MLRQEAVGCIAHALSSNTLAGCCGLEEGGDSKREVGNGREGAWQGVQAVGFGSLRANAADSLYFTEGVHARAGGCTLHAVAWIYKRGTINKREYFYRSKVQDEKF